MSKILFPYDSVRDHQDVLIKKINEAVDNKKDLIAHAPTGLGKTAASLAATISNTVETDKTIFFLTSMHSQHKIALDTVREIKQKHDVKLVHVNVIGKKHLCLQDGVQNLGTREFADYCRTLRDDGKCQYYNNLKNGEDLTTDTKLALNRLKDSGDSSTENLLTTSEMHEVCPYEVGMILGKESNVVITDYYYLFHPRIRDNFLKKIDKNLQDAIIIVDEAHNLPNRIKHLASEEISSYSINRALSEADDLNDATLMDKLKKLHKAMKDLSKGEEVHVKKGDFMDKVYNFTDYDSLIEELEDLAEEIREEKKTSSLGAIASFLQSWKTDHSGYTRILRKDEGLRDYIYKLSHRCLDPGRISKHVIDNATSTIMMSGTLTPTSMYKEILGFPQDTEELVLQSPFPQKNRLNIVVPKTSTKYTKRSPKQYEKTGKTISEMANLIPGNVAVFFPSYHYKDKVLEHMYDCEKTVFQEKAGLSKREKEELLDNFKKYKDAGAVLLGAISGSFGEGVDLPGDYLKGVIIVGLPFRKPDLETKALINYYDRKFGKGWDYGYTFPTFNKTLQSAGRCIRSETDKGVIIFLEERYAWPRYKKLFPNTWEVKTTLLYKNMIKRFFDQN